MAGDEPAAEVGVAEPVAHRTSGWWIEQAIPRVVGAVFAYAGVTKLLNPTKTHDVLAFDDVPGALVAPLTHVIWLGEITLGLLLLIGMVKRRVIVAAVLVLLVYSVQLAYLIAAQNPPNCACLDVENIARRYASAKQVMMMGLVRNAVMAMGLEWVRLRGISRACRNAPAQNEKDGPG